MSGAGLVAGARQLRPEPDRVVGAGIPGCAGRPGPGRARARRALRARRAAIKTSAYLLSTRSRYESIFRTDIHSLSSFGEITQNQLSDR